ncbi:hypothetical protein MKX08_002341 [Trichoderma sp. CBMAI-0020]|nr:hypothetical protein MKX08_002341 [Trichoderma sp. CBMAI-0020]
MAEQMSTPRITAAYLDSFVGRTVTIVGKVTQLRGDQATIDADGIVTILLNRVSISLHALIIIIIIIITIADIPQDSHLANGNAAQVIGKVNPDLSIKALSTRDVGPGVGHGVSPLRNPEPQHQPHIAMVWPLSPNALNPSPSSPAPHRRLSIGRLHRTASPVRNPDSSLSASSSSQRDWQHQRQQQWLDLIPYDAPAPSPSPPPFEQHQHQSSQQSSSMPPTAYNPMPGSFHSDFESGLPSSDEEAIFRLAHATSPFSNSNNSPFEPREELQIQPFSVVPSAQPRSSFISSSPSPPPFANMSTYSTQAASYSLPSPPTSQLERPESPLSVADSQPTLRQGDSRILSPPMSSIPRTQNRIRGGSGSGRHAQNSEDVDTRALNAVVDGIGRMQVNMNLDQAGRWRIARRPGAPW